MDVNQRKAVTVFLQILTCAHQKEETDKIRANKIINNFTYKQNPVKT